MVEHINQVLNKFIDLGAKESEIWHYGMPSWWTPEMDTNWAAISEATTILSDRYQVPAGRLLLHGPVKLMKPLNQALLDYTKLLLRISKIKKGQFYFSPTKTYEVMSKKKNNPLIKSESLKWYMYSVDDLVFLERVLNFKSTLV